MADKKVGMKIYKILFFIATFPPGADLLPRRMRLGRIRLWHEAEVA
jgi:hypothetical protein